MARDVRFSMSNGSDQVFTPVPSFWSQPAEFEGITATHEPPIFWCRRPVFSSPTRCPFGQSANTHVSEPVYCVSLPAFPAHDPVESTATMYVSPGVGEAGGVATDIDLTAMW